VTVLNEFGQPVESQVVGADLIDLLEELQSVSFDESFFSDPTLNSLTDYAIDLGTQPQGRTNPFVEIGR